MLSAQTTHVARPLIVLKTDGRNNHAATAWASAVASGMVSFDPGMPLARRSQAVLLHAKLERMLVEAFHEVTPLSSMGYISALAQTCMARVEEIFAPTPWAFQASAPQIRAEFERYITRNLASAADIAVKME